MRDTFFKLIGAVAVAVALSFASPQTAAADTVHEKCSNAGNISMLVAKFRDSGIPLEITVNGLVAAGLPEDAAGRLTVWVYINSQLDRVTIGRYFYQFCMAEAGEPS
jgi:hypothetical protein